MRWLFILIMLFLGCSPGLADEPIEGKILKVLPQLLDKQGRNSVSPSLYDRDAYQAILREHPDQVSALRFAVQWKARVPETEPLRLRVEMRGMAHDLKLGELPKETVLEQPVHSRSKYNHWASIDLSAELYRAYGQITAWRVTLWDGDRLLSEQKSFLW